MTAKNTSKKTATKPTRKPPSAQRGSIVVTHLCHQHFPRKIRSPSLEQRLHPTNCDWGWMLGVAFVSQVTGLLVLSPTPAKYLNPTESHHGIMGIGPGWHSIETSHLLSIINLAGPDPDVMSMDAMGHPVKTKKSYCLY